MSKNNSNNRFHLRWGKNSRAEFETWRGELKCDLRSMRDAWKNYQASKSRIAIYSYLEAVFDTVIKWKKRKKWRWAMEEVMASCRARNDLRADPYSVFLFCTADRDKVDHRARSKWSRALKWAEKKKPVLDPLAKFLTSQGGLNACATKYSELRKSG